MRIAIVNDLPIAAEALRRAVTMRPEHEVIWTARDGAEAVAACKQQLPDLVLMDLIMPGMDGVEATRRIMTETPCAILIVTVSVGANTPRVFEAMGHGALDAIDTPSLGGADSQASAALLLTKIDSIRKLMAGRTGEYEIARGNTGTVSILAPTPLVAIGSSAGGPAALLTVLSALPGDFPAAVVLVQHVDAKFAQGMASWLNERSRLRVRIAEQGDRPESGTVLLAGTNDHLTLMRGGRLGYTPEPSEYAYRPSVDVLFHSICRLWAFPAVGVLLTGMGSDGAAGLKAMRDKGFHTIAQDQASSSVYGMPKAAAKLNAAVDILPLDQIADRLRRQLQ
jgi:two-component system response regulator WspF